MAKYTDRNGKSLDMIKRTVRLTDQENEVLDMLLEETGLKLRDLIAGLVIKEYEERHGGNNNDK